MATLRIKYPIREHPPLTLSEALPAWRWSSTHCIHLLPSIVRRDTESLVPEVQRSVAHLQTRILSGIPWDADSNSCAWDNAINMAICLGIAAYRCDLIPQEHYTSSLVSSAHHEFRKILWQHPLPWETLNLSQKSTCRQRIHNASTFPKIDNGFKSVARAVEELLAGSLMASWTYRRYKFCVWCDAGMFSGRPYRGTIDLSEATRQQIRHTAELHPRGKMPLSEVLAFWSGNSIDKRICSATASCRRKLSTNLRVLDRLPYYLPVGDSILCALADVVQWEDVMRFGMLHESGTYIWQEYKLRGVHVYRGKINHFEYYGKLTVQSDAWYRWGRLKDVQTRRMEGHERAEQATFAEICDSDVRWVYAIYEQTGKGSYE